jgi:CubicO group peptidase (beta-lactamase class C family)
MNVTSAEMYHRLSSVVLIYPPGLEPSYSNIGPAVLGRVLENVLEGGMTWEAYVEREMVQRLGLTNTHTTLETNNLAVGYNADGTPAPLADLGKWCSSHALPVGFRLPTRPLSSCSRPPPPPTVAGPNQRACLI